MQLRNGHDGVVPAIADEASITWAFKKKIGDTLDYIDEHGNTFKFRLVGAIANSILQGNLIIDEAEFLKHFPNQSGYRMFLIDAPPSNAPIIARTLSRALQDVGLDLTPATDPLNAFMAVQNTYLDTFQILGALGLLLGSAGLGAVVLRNVLERRGELAALLAVGFQPASIRALVLFEHAALLALGLILGTAAAAIALLPALLSPQAHVPFLSLALVVGLIFLNGFFWSWLALRLALTGNLLQALRNE
jgi:ABC-type antimicrobial peptide transport system permease subunit